MPERIAIYFIFFCMSLAACSSLEKGSVPQAKRKDINDINIDSLTVYKQKEIDNEPQIIGGKYYLARTMDYPKEALDRNIHGRVVVKFIVLKTGEDVNHVIIESAHPVLNKAAIKTIERASFKPGMINGRPVNTIYTIPLTYRMNKTFH